MNLSALRSTYLSRAIQTALHIHKTSEEDDESNTSGDILVFLTGQNEIETACRAVKEDQREYLRENRKARELGKK